MRKSLKIAAMATVAFMVLGAIAFVYAGSQNALNANASEEQVGTSSFSGSNNVTCPGYDMMPGGRMGHMRSMRGNGFGLNEEFLQNATLSTVDGTVVSTVGGMLVLNTDTTQVRVLLPKEWTLSDEVVNSASLFNGTFASAGQSVTVKVLKSDLVSNASFSVNVMIAYEAINATGIHAYAVLPFNIQPNS